MAFPPQGIEFYFTPAWVVGGTLQVRFRCLLSVSIQSHYKEGARIGRSLFGQ